MKRKIELSQSGLLTALLFLSLLASPFSGNSQSVYQREELARHEEISKPGKLNNKNFQKNLEKYAHELDLKPKQVKKLNRIERKYNRKENKLARKPNTKKKHLRALQKDKREQMIAVLDHEQQHKLHRLSKSRSNFWNFVKQKE